MKRIFQCLVILSILFLAACQGTTRERAPGETLTIMLPVNVPMELVKIPAGTFMMGSLAAEISREADEGPQTEVTISRDFYMGKFTVTKAQWEALMGTRPWAGKSRVLDHPDSPAVDISWNDICGSNGFRVLAVQQ